MTYNNSTWKQKNFQEYWNTVAPSEHVVQIYDSERIFLNTLEGFVGNGILTGDTVVIIARRNYLENISKRLFRQGFDLDRLSRRSQYVALDAEKLLSKFMVNGEVAVRKFNDVAGSVFSKLSKSGRRVRAFGEMVGMLCAEGNSEAAAKLESLWNKLIAREGFCLFCAYGKDQLENTSENHVHEICTAHSHIIRGEESAPTDIHYLATR